MCFSTEISQDLKFLSERFSATIDQTAYREFARLREQFPRETKVPKDDNRIFPNYWAPVVVLEEGKRWIRPMRYRVRPAHSEKEVPSKYNLFNARLDSLESRATWKPLFMKNHCLFPFTKFFEWVEDEKGKKKLLSFSPRDRSLMWAPALWDRWVSPDGSLVITSFALITDDPPPEISEMGHDRCPIFLQESFIPLWMDPQKSSKKDIYAALKHREDVFYQASDLAAA